MKTKFFILLLITSISNLFAQCDLISYETTENFIMTNLTEYLPDFSMNEEGEINYFQIKKHEFNILTVESEDNITLEESQGYYFINFNDNDKLIIDKTEKAKRILNAFKNYFELVKKIDLDKKNKEKENKQKKDGSLFSEEIKSNKKTTSNLSEKKSLTDGVENNFISLSWEKNNPDRKAWSNYTYKLIDSLYTDSFELCEDIKKFRSDYDTLSKNQKINVWAELISAISFYESGWKLNSLMEEKSLGIDKVTGQVVKSEGLLQLSYQDKINYPNLPCKFNWEIDKNLENKDLSKTIFNYKYNLELGVNILAQQIRNKKTIILKNKVYWAVLKEGGKYSKIDEISKKVESLKF